MGLLIRSPIFVMVRPLERKVALSIMGPEGPQLRSIMLGPRRTSQRGCSWHPAHGPVCHATNWQVEKGLSGLRRLGFRFEIHGLCGDPFADCLS